MIFFHLSACSNTLSVSLAKAFAKKEYALHNFSISQVRNNYCTIQLGVEKA